MLGVAVGAYGEHLISAREMSDMRADAAKAQTKAAEAARTEEQRRTAAQREIATDANQQRIVALADAFAARAAAGSLQQRIDQLVAAARNPAAAAGSPSAADALDLLADVLGRTDETAGELARIADERGIAGEQCARDYTALTTKTIE
ncbi:DUF2514 domain-containing protein [Burkholderia ambifaria]|uniref:DUF2514 family protein n=1 Tax=Burkholderia ambifaria TaxID=152480 RepID=UPI001E429A44|nr:DUF2514 family protein [Burkholderia ambifaria]UEP49791.1 DUF2514 domain-containing protein [Burkholderia ambifaria]